MEDLPVGVICTVTDSCLDFALDCGYLAPAEHTELTALSAEVGKLLGALLPITIQILVTAPELAMLLLLGGIAPEQVIQAVLVLAAAAVASGSLGGLIALWREKTYQSIALSVLFLVLYICLTQAIGVVGPLLSDSVNWTTVQAWFDPFVAMAARAAQLAASGSSS